MTNDPRLPSDPAKATYRDQWNVSADGWNTWWHVFERGAQCLNDELVARAGLVAGQRVLDVACGLGEPSFTAARRVGVRGSVLGIDLAPRMVELATQKARERGLAHVRFETGDAEDLRVPPRSFDAAVSRFGLMLLPRPELGATGIARALVPGGTFATAVWSGPEDVPFLGVPQAVGERLGVLPPLDPALPGPLRMGRPGQLEACLRAGGFEAVDVRPFRLTMEFLSAREFLDFQRGMQGTLRRALDTLDAATAARGWAELERDVRPWIGADGAVRFPCVAWVGTGRVPAARA